MKYVVLADGTRIDNCNDSTTPNEIYVIRETYGEAAAVRDLFTAENASVIRVYNSNDILDSVGSDLVLEDRANLFPSVEGIICNIIVRAKTNEEKMQDEIRELQDVVLG